MDAPGTSIVCLSFSIPMFHNGFSAVASWSVDDPSSRRGFLENRRFQGRLGAWAASSAMVDGQSGQVGECCVQTWDSPSAVQSRVGGGERTSLRGCREALVYRLRRGQASKARAASDRVGVIGEVCVRSGAFRDAGPHESFTQRPGWVCREEQPRGAGGGKLLRS